MKSEDYIQEYYDCNAKKLHFMVDGILKNMGGVTDKDHFYSLANEVFVHDILKNYDGESDFDAFAYSCLRNKIFSELTHMNCNSQMPYARDSMGNKIKNKDGNFIRLPVLYLDATTQNEDGEETTFLDLVKSGYDLEEEILNYEKGGSQIALYLQCLSKTQQKIVLLLIEGYRGDEIREILHMSMREYNDNLINIKSSDNMAILFSRR